MSTAVKTPPTTYSEWAAVLEMLKAKSDDEAYLELMQKGTIEWQFGVAERFTQKLVDVINYRMNAATDRFTTAMRYANGQEYAIVQALLALRREMCFLMKAIDIPAIPGKDRYKYCQLVIDQANSIQSSLEDSAKKDRSGKLASIVRNHKVNVF